MSIGKSVVLSKAVFGVTVFVAAAMLLAGATRANDTVYYYSSDTVHSEVVVTDASRSVVERTYYAPYGQVLNRDLRDGPGYSGHEEDPETNLVYMQQRYYDPGAGRFLSTDPVQADGGGGSFNRYEYANDNPYRYTDPDGRDITEALGGLFYETASFVTGNGFHGSQIAGALADGYNGEGGGVGHALLEDANTAFDALGAAGAIKGAAALVGRIAIKQVVKEGAELGAKEAAKTGEKFTKEVVERQAPGRDGASSQHIIEKLDGKTNSVTHQVTKDGQTIHQHQTHIGKYGTERQFPDKWIEHPKVPKENGG